MRKAPQLDHLFCAWRYIEPLDAVIQGLKFHDLSYLGKHLALELDRVLPPTLRLDAVVPLPLHWIRAWTRGYNQATEIARPLARRRSWKLEDVLVRRSATRAQSGLDRAERKRNLSRAFVVRSRGRRWRWRLRRHSSHWSQGFDARGKSLLLIDDVYTTGSTLEAAALALKTAGAGWVGAAVAGRTPDPRD